MSGDGGPPAGERPGHRTVLVVVESPSKARKIQAFLRDPPHPAGVDEEEEEEAKEGGCTYVVRATRGHILRLPRRGYGFDPKLLDADFEPEYEVEKPDVVSGLREAAGAAAEVLIATDGDREGAAIGFHVLSVLGVDWRVARRAVFFEVTRDAVRAAVANPVPLDALTGRDALERHKLDRALIRLDVDRVALGSLVGK